MGQAIPTQHPAVVLRSHYRNLRAMLAVAMIAVVALTGAVVILAINEDTGATQATENVAVPDVVGRGANPADTFNEGRDAQAAERALQIRSEAMNDVRAVRAQDFAATQAEELQPAPGIRYDGGPEEGTRGALQQSAQPLSRYDGGPEEGTRGPLVNPSTPAVSRYDGGPEEGTRGPLASTSSPADRYDGGPEEGSRGPGH